MRLKYGILPTISISLMIIVIFVSIFAKQLAPFDPFKIDMNIRLQGPSLTHLLGTDILGRDLLSRVIYGGRVSILLSIVVTFLALLIGLVVGSLSGYYGGIVDFIITNITSIFQGLPGISMMIVIVAIMGPKPYSLLLGLVINSWTGFSRIVRGEVMKIKRESFIEGAKTMGASDVRILLKYVIPNILPNVTVIFTNRIVATMLSIGGLSFLGLGIQPPTPDWGMMINESRSFMESAPLLVIAPGLCIVAISLGLNYIGEIFRQALKKTDLERY